MVFFYSQVSAPAGIVPEKHDAALLLYKKGSLWNPVVEKKCFSSSRMSSLEFFEKILNDLSPAIYLV